MVWLLIIGGVNWDAAFVIFAMIYSFSVLMTFFLLYFDYSIEAVPWYNRSKSYWHLVFAALIEPFVYHPFVSYCSNIGYFQYIKGSTAVWKPIARKGVQKKK